MKKPNWFKQLEIELEEKRKYRQKHDKSTIWDGISIAVPFMILMALVINDSQTYFYKNFFFSALAGFIVFILLFSILLPKIVDLSKIFTFGHHVGIFFLGITLSFIIVPKIAHYYFMDKQNVCVTTQIERKSWHRYADTGVVYFHIPYTPGESYEYYELSKVDSISGFSQYELDNLPKEKTPIKLCGMKSKIGFNYTNIESISLIPDRANRFIP
jgi:hypothetical protein